MENKIQIKEIGAPQGHPVQEAAESSVREDGPQPAHEYPEAPGGLMMQTTRTEPPLK
jgi:hypothetical protein